MRSTILKLSICLTLFGNCLFSQGYDIRINIKGAKDTMAYLVKYIWDQKYIVDTCKKVKNGQIQFKGKEELDKGVYVLVSEGKSIYFDIFVNEGQKFSIACDLNDLVNTIKITGSKENENFFSYIRQVTNKNKEYGKYLGETKGMSKADSTKYMNDKIKVMNDDMVKFEKDFMEKMKGTYLWAVLNQKSEKNPDAAVIPKASNGRNDSVWVYYWYKNHFFDGMDMTDDRTIHTPFFADRLKRYFESVILQAPDTIIAEIDNVLAKCKPDGECYNLLLGHFTFKYEQDKRMGFDKVFVHICDKYIISGKAKKVYDAETTKKIKDRADIMRNLLLESKVPEIYMIDTIHGREVMKLGFDTAKTSESITKLYYKNETKLTPMFRSLAQVNSKYTVLVFWSVDCGHCQTEIPKLNDTLKTIKGKIDFKVMAVYTKEDFEAWRKFIIDKKLDFINVFDPVHINDLKNKFDIYSTPVIYILDKDKKIKAKRLDYKQVIGMLKFLEEQEKQQQQKK